MDAHTDTFPRDEVTGLAAFDHLDPVSTVSTLNVMPEPPAPASRVFAPPPPPAAVSRPPSRPPSLPPSRPPSVTTLPPPVPVASRTFARPQDSAVVPGRPVSTPPAPPGSRPDQTEQIQLQGPAAAPLAAGSAYEGWDASEEEDDAVTRVVKQASVGVASLQMDWDEAEPPTKMRGESGVSESIQTRAHGELAAASAGLESGRPSPFPGTRTSVAPIAMPSSAPASSPRAGVPSPFTAADTQSFDTEAWEDGLRGTRRPWLFVGAGAVVIIALGFLVRAMLASPAPGVVTLATTPADAQVTIDGKPVLGSSSPFSLTNLAPGVTHELVVQKEGFATYKTSFTLAEGETKALSTVQLAAEARDVGFAIGSRPAGADVRVDGQSVGLVTPARVVGLTPGLHTVELVADGYRPFGLQVFVPDNAMLDLPIAELARDPKASSFGRIPPSDGARAASSRSARGGHVRAHHASGQRHQASRASAPPRTVAPSRFKTGKAVAKVAAPAAGQGMLRVNTRPWSQIFVNGKLRGNTPQMGISLPAGKHTVKFVNPEMRLAKTITVDIAAGATVTKVVNLVD